MNLVYRVLQVMKLQSRTKIATKDAVAYLLLFYKDLKLKCIIV